MARKNVWGVATKHFPKGHGVCLDLGAGSGRMRHFICDQGYIWIGLDQKRHIGLTVVADAHNLPFKTNAFDVLFMSAVLEHLHHPHKAMHEVHRVLKTHGILYGWAAFLEPYHVSYCHFSFRGLETLLNDCSFDIVSLWPGPHALNAILLNLLPIIPEKFREKMTEIFALLHARVGLWYLKRTMVTVDGVPSESLTLSDMLFKFAEGYGFYAIKVEQITNYHRDVKVEGKLF